MWRLKFIIANLLLLALFFPPSGKTAVAPVGQLPSVSASATPSAFILPILLLNDLEEWKDFGLQVNLKIYNNSGQQMDGLLGNEWEVAVMDPFSAVKGGNDGEVAIVGLAGDFSSQVSSPFSKKTYPQALRILQNGFISRVASAKSKDLIPAFLVASASYADTRKTLVLRWLEGYSRGIRVVQEDYTRATARLQKFYQETGKLEVGSKLLEEEIRKAFRLTEKEREDLFGPREGKPNSIAVFAEAMTHYQTKMKVLENRRAPEEYILAKIGDQLTALRKEAESQLKKTQDSIEEAEKTGVEVKKFRQTWEEAQRKIQEGRGYLTVIGILSDLQRSAEQAQAANIRLKKFRHIELSIGGMLIIYYAGYFIHRKNSRKGGRGNRSG